MTTTMNTKPESVLKKDLIEGVQFDEAGKPAKVYGKIAGLTNLGRTYFISRGEISKKNDVAQAQMAQKYGAEIFGISAMQKNISANTSGVKGAGNNGGGAGAETGSASSTTSGGGGLIKCTVNEFMKIPEKFLKESGGASFDSFKKSFDDLIKKLRKPQKGAKPPTNEQIKELTDKFEKFKKSDDGNSKDNKKVWKELLTIFKDKAPWNAMDSLREDGADYKSLKDAYDAWCAGDSDFATGAATSKGTDWNANYSYRIDVQTSFDDTWFKRKFKSGFLNKALMFFKTSNAQLYTDKNPMKNHVYTADEMLPADKRKLDSIQWKMTNKVAKDYIMYLLGWTRKTEYYLDGTTPVAPELKWDSGFGKKMADKALSNRGILGRLKQKIFAGGQANNVISVAFQLADPATWKQKKSPKKQPTPGKTNPEEKPVEKPAKSSEEPVNESVSKVLEFTLSIPDDVVVKLVNESIDELEMEALAKEVCESGNGIDELIEKHLCR